MVPDDIAALAYMAGIIDGEGCISISASFDKKKSKSWSYTPKVQINNCDTRMLDWIAERFGSHHAPMGDRDIREGRGWRVCHTWSLHSQNAGRLLLAVLPYLVCKRRQAEIVIEMTSHDIRPGRPQSPEIQERRAALKQEMHMLNKRGA